MQTKGLHAPQAAVRATMAVALWSLCVISAGAETRDGRFERTFAVGGDTLVLDVQTGSGRIAVTAGEPGRVRVSGRIRGYADRRTPDGARVVAERVRTIQADPPIELTSNVLRVKHLRSSLRRQVGVSYEVVVPANTRVRAQTGSGDVFGSRGLPARSRRRPGPVARSYRTLAETRRSRRVPQRLDANGGVVELLLSPESSQLDPAYAHLVEVPADADDGFHFPYYLFVPRGTPRGQSVRLLVEPNNTGQTTDDFGRHREHAKRMASRGDARRLADRLRTPLLVPVFPRPSHNGLYTHALDRDTMLWANDPLRRIDLQLIEMIRHARRLLLRNGVAAHRKVFLHGFSASGTFVNRFAALHPDLVRAVAAGGINGLPILPFAALRTTPLPYPVGVGDLETIVGTPFDLAAYRRVSQYLHMGYLDRNDTLPYGDAWNDTERALIARLLGEEMMPTRWERGRTLLAEAELPVQTVTYNGVAHRILPEMWDDIVAFFEANDGEAHTSISPHPYRFVPYRRIENAHVRGVYWKGDPRLPEPLRRPGEAVAVVISIEEWIDRQDRTQLTAFVEHAGFEFTLSAPGHDEIRILRDAFCGTGTSGDGGFQAFYVCLDPATIEAIAAGIEYTLTPINAGDAHAWIVRDGVRLLRP